MTQRTLPEGGDDVTSYFAPAGRADEELLRELSARALANPLVRVVLEAVGGFALIVDTHRQIIAANQEVLDLLGLCEHASLIGRRPGEAVACTNAVRGPNGCGTSQQCQHCGAVISLLAAQAGDAPVEELCTITCREGAALVLHDFKVRASPLVLGGERVYALVFHDVTSEKWRDMHEKLFVHDLNNILSGLIGWGEELLAEPSVGAATRIVELARHLGEHLAGHRALMQCESGELQLTRECIDIDALVVSLQSLFGGGSEDCARRFVVEKQPKTHPLYTDRKLLGRVLANLVKNALEATKRGDVVTLRISGDAEHTEFRVHNSSVIPPDIAGSLFHRRVSTKGPGRGLGMYAVQVLGEQCLGGQVSFQSTEECGTEFSFRLPNAALSPSPPTE